jgi:hypothetical protein
VVACPSGDSQPRWLTVVGSLADAKREHARARADLGTVRHQSIARMTLREHARDFFQARQPVLRPATVAAYDYAYRLRIDPYLGEEALESLTRLRLDRWIAALIVAEPDRRRSLEHAVQTLSTMLSVAVD